MQCRFGSAEADTLQEQVRVGPNSPASLYSPQHLRQGLQNPDNAFRNPDSAFINPDNAFFKRGATDCAGRISCTRYAAAKPITEKLSVISFRVY